MSQQDQQAPSQDRILNLESGLANLAKALQRARANNATGTSDVKIGIIMGAGCSVTAGIPAAKEMVEQIKAQLELSKYIKQTFENEADNNNYNTLMRHISTNDQKAIFRHFINQAKINTTHLYLAELIKQGIVDCVLTTNFDPLLVQAMALNNDAPAIYDTTLISRISHADISYPAVFYLHGQSKGFDLLNDREQLNIKHMDVLNNIVAAVLPHRLWIVVGYSGKSDPFFEKVLSHQTFGDGLYWVGYKAYEPEDHVRKLVGDNRDCCYIKGNKDDFNSDIFFHKLFLEASIEQPRLIEKPFEYLLETQEKLEALTQDGLPDPRVEGNINKIKDAINFINTANTPNWPEIASSIFFNERFEELVEKYKEYEKIHNDISEEITDSADRYFAAAFNNYAILLLNQGRLEEAEAQCKKALELDPNDAEVLNNYAIILFHQGRLEEAETYIKKAHELNPNLIEGNNNYANLLGKLGRYEEAEAQYKKTLELKPNYADAHSNYANLLKTLKRYEEAEVHYKKALELDPYFAEVYYNYAVLLKDIGKVAEAKTVHAQALKLNPKLPKIDFDS